MHDRVDAFERPARRVPDVAEPLAVQPPLGQHRRAGQALAEEAGVEPRKVSFRPRLAQMLDHDRADVAHVARDEDPHR